MKRVHAALRRLGLVGREGSRHTVFKDPDDQNRMIVVPRHTQVKGPVLGGNLRSVGISEEEFMAVY